MPRIMVDRHAIVPSKDGARLDLQVEPGALVVRVEHDGVRVLVGFDASEAQAFAVAMIALAHDASRLPSVAQAAPTSPALVGG